MNSLTEFKKIPILPLLIAVTLVIGRASPVHAADLAATPVIDWSNEARRAIVPPSAGAENYGNKFPGEAALYMGIVHAAMYDAAVAIEGGYQPYAIELIAPPDTSSAAAIATAAHHTLIGLQPPLGLTQAQVDYLNGIYDAYMDAIPPGTAKTNGIMVGEQVAAAVVALRMNDGRELNPTLADLNPPPPGPGIWERNPGNPLPPVLGLRLPGIRPLALESASQFRPDGPNPLTSEEYAEDFNQVKELGRLDSATRTPAQTAQALFWTDHDLRQWNDGMLNLAVGRGLDLVQTARMLAMAHVSGGDAMIAGFEAKYHYWFWRPITAIHQAAFDGNPATEPDPTWVPLRTTPNHPEYPAAHAFHSSALAAALRAFFGTDNVTFTLDSRVTGTTREYNRFHDAVKDVNLARTLAGFHFRNSCEEGANLGRDVSRYVVEHYFQPIQ
ncbi:MAG TPA: vanadium-dependent haloperoxidase [Bradyrhizobium sp.]|nr:vanadium-dependent haloperoxidase [Bradyrhizobium sp.]